VRPTPSRYGYGIIRRDSGEVEAVLWTREDARQTREVMGWKQETHRIDRVKVLHCAR
jgi:hypothetical protein